eukprot:g61860.t1
MTIYSKAKKTTEGYVGLLNACQVFISSKDFHSNKHAAKKAAMRRLVRTDMSLMLFYVALAMRRLVRTDMSLMLFY